MQRSILGLGLAIVFLFSIPALAQEVRYVERDGVTWRETRRIVQQPVTSTEWQTQERTVYKDQYVTEMRDSYRTVYSPVTEYRMQPRLHNWWNPFGRPYVAYHMLPSTRWETRVERVQSPVTYRQVVPETELVQVPTRSLSMREREVIDRVAVNPRTTPSSVTAARPTQTRVAIAPAPLEPVGGIRRIENDPPRQGMTPHDLRGDAFRR